MKCVWNKGRVENGATACSADHHSVGSMQSGERGIVLVYVRAIRVSRRGGGRSEEKVRCAK